MPMIIKNGKRYCSTGGEADNIVYDNTNSGLDSTNMQDAIDEINSNFSNTWINNSDVYEEIEKKVAEYGAASTFMLSFGTNNTNTPEGWNWWCLIYKCAKIIAWEHAEVCTNARNGANNYVGWERPLVANDGLKFKFGKDGDGNYGYYGADGSLIPFKKTNFIMTDKAITKSISSHSWKRNFYNYILEFEAGCYDTFIATASITMNKYVYLIVSYYNGSKWIELGKSEKDDVNNTACRVGITNAKYELPSTATKVKLTLCESYGGGSFTVGKCALFNSENSKVSFVETTGE